jgi:hypothetical protein
MNVRSVHGHILRKLPLAAATDEVELLRADWVYGLDGRRSGPIGIQMKEVLRSDRASSPIPSHHLSLAMAGVPVGTEAYAESLREWFRVAYGSRAAA